jgi:hypothetical protein
MEEYLKNKGCAAKIIPHAADCNGNTAPPKVFGSWVPPDIAKMRYPDGGPTGVDDPMDIDVPIDITPAQYNMQQKVEEYNQQQQQLKQQQQQQQYFYPMPMPMPMPINNTGPAPMDWQSKVPMNPADMDFTVQYM